MTIASVSLTYLLDFVLKSGTPKLTVVENFKKRPDYHPQTDFYKQLRRELVRTARGQTSIKQLRSWVGTVDKKKRGHYLANAAGFQKFLGTKSVTWFNPPKADHDLGGITVTVNPELGLVINDVEHVIKLYLKDDSLPKNRAQLIMFLMTEALAGKGDTRAFGVLDTRKGKLHLATKFPTSIGALLLGEAASFATIYRSL